jgi:hypothetical protein
VPNKLRCLSQEPFFLASLIFVYNSYGYQSGVPRVYPSYTFEDSTL